MSTTEPLRDYPFESTRKALPRTVSFRCAKKFSPKKSLVMRQMQKFFPALGLFALLLPVMWLASCQEQELVSAQAEAEDYVVEAVTLIEDSTQSGAHGCYELLYPIDLSLPDGSTVTADSAQELRQALLAWRLANPGVAGHPSLVFPLDLIDEDGNILTMQDRLELRRYRAQCGRGFRARQHFRPFRQCGTPCFRITFPVTLHFPDSTTTPVDDRLELRQEVRAWFANNPGAGRPWIGFPLTVRLADGSTVIVNDRLELQAIKRTCRGN